MIVSIRGKILEKHTEAVIIDVGGLGYECFVSVNTYDRLPKVGEEVSLLTYYHITENNHSLYGFSEPTEKALFTMLISVSGIGPRTAIALLSAVSPDEFRRRLVAGEVKMLTALPGIGPKTARRIIVELKDKFVKLSEEELPIESTSEIQPEFREAHNALVTLGFRPADIAPVLKEISDGGSSLSTEEIIKLVLTKLR
ncbi:MAG: Holliday junction branch migration protein RuvA [Fidelibacterota bacterium]